MFENPLDRVWLVAGAALAAVFGLAGLVLAVYAVRRRRPVLGVVLGVLAVGPLAAGAAISIRAEAWLLCVGSRIGHQRESVALLPFSDPASRYPAARMPKRLARRKSAGSGFPGAKRSTSLAQLLGNSWSM